MSGGAGMFLAWGVRVPTWVGTASSFEFSNGYAGLASKDTDRQYFTTIWLKITFVGQLEARTLDSSRCPSSITGIHADHLDL